MPVITGLHEYAATCDANGQPRPYGMHKRKDGQHVADVFPQVGGWAAQVGGWVEVRVGGGGRPQSEEAATG